MLWTAISYCGPAPVPAEIWARWNLDPWLIAVLAAAAMGWIAFARARTGTRHGSFWADFALLLILFVSPLCALSAALFAARSVHHLLLVALAAPLLVLAGLRLARLPIGMATGLHILIFWAWHIPGLYAWALSHDAAYWLMQASLLGSAMIFWSAVLDRRASGVAALGALLAMIVQMGILGAILTFAGQPFYAPHFLTTASWGLSPVEDQQIAGLIMWVASIPFYLAAAVAPIRSLLTAIEAPRAA
jgi:putative membrane protein